MPKPIAPGSADTLPMMTRAMPVSTIDREARTVEIVWTTGATVRRYDHWREEYFDEQLIVSPEAVDLTRLNSGAPFLNQHSSWSLSDVLGVVERAWLAGSEGRALIRFPKEGVNPAADQIFELMADGIIRNISAGYSITKVEREKRDGQPTLWRVVEWQPYEISAVSVGADDGAKTRADDGAKTYPVTFLDRASSAPNTESSMPNPVESPAVPQVETRAAPVADTAAAIAAATTAERARVRDLNDIATRSGLVADVLARAIDAGTDVEAFRRTAFDHLAAQADQTRTSTAAPGRVIEDERDKLVEGATRGLLMRAGRDGGERNEFTGMSLARLAEESLVRSGVKIQRRGLPMVGDAFQQRGGAHSSGDFPLILENVVNKSMLSGWDQADTTYQIWTKKGSLSDFKTASRYGVGPLPLLAKKAEGSKYEYASLGESKATVMLGTYGQMFAITRELVINDDMNALSDIPMKQGRAARLTVDMLPYALITANAAWQGGVALFHANRKNLAGAAAIPSAASFAAAAKAMRTGHNEGADGKTRLRIAAKYGLFPEALRFDVLKLLASGTELGQSNPNIVNPVKNFVEPVFSDWLDDASAAAWYFAADKINDTVEVSFLDGNDSPFLDQQQGWTVDGTEFKVRIDAGASVLDPRGLYKNAGV